MRDIRQDLTERLTAIRSERDALQNRLESLNRQEDIIAILLQEEGRRWSKLQSAPLFVRAEDSLRENGKSRTPLSQLILEKLADGNIWSAHDLATEAVKRGYPFGEKSPNRAAHFALVGMARSGRVESLGKGKWRIEERPSIPGLQ